MYIVYSNIIFELKQKHYITLSEKIRKSKPVQIQAMCQEMFKINVIPSLRESSATHNHVFLDAFLCQEHGILQSRHLHSSLRRYSVLKSSAYILIDRFYVKQGVNQLEKNNLLMFYLFFLFASRHIYMCINQTVSEIRKQDI